MSTRRVAAGRGLAGAALLMVMWLTAHAGVASASPLALGQQLPTPTPFRFLTPTPFVPRATTTTTSATAPNAGGLPMELAIPALAGGLAAIGGGSVLLRRKSAR
jgi:hypothetical protein